MQGQCKGSFPNGAQQVSRAQGGEVAPRVTEKDRGTQQLLEIHPFKEERMPGAQKREVGKVK